jgi:hypothetical protein
VTIPLTQPPLESGTASLVEAVANVMAGFVLAVLVQLGAYPLLGITTTVTQDRILALLFTGRLPFRGCRHAYVTNRLQQAFDGKCEDI